MRTNRLLLETMGAVRLLLDGGPWPASELKALMVAANYSERTIGRAVAELKASGELQTENARYFVAPAFAGLTKWVEGYPRQSLLAQLVPSQSSVIGADEIELELARDAWVDVMGAETLRRGRRAAA